MKKMTRFIFDVDGTLTPSRQKMDPVFKEFFLEFIKNNDVWLVTGSDYAKTLEQLGADVTENVITVYNCSGNETRFKGKIVNASSWALPPNAKYFLDSCEWESKFPIRTGNHIEERRGMVNFSVVGRNCNIEERAKYIEWDKEHNEREKISSSFNIMFPELQATIGGETGLDISLRGNDKSQILCDFNSDDEIRFYGDAMHKGGNDEPLARALSDMPNSSSHAVTCWEDTFTKLQIIESIMSEEYE